jgi:hypothetical protein
MIVFNRPRPTRKVFAAVRGARPSRLYIAADGPRPDRDGDALRCAEVRRVADEVDWPCEVHTQFQDANLGCGPGPSQAITWFFEQEEAGVILEDDCLPHPDFFAFCEWALERYHDDRRVWHVGGNNFAAAPELFAGASVGFVSLAQVWGWATWRDRWAAYEYDAKSLLEMTGERWRDWRLNVGAAQIKLTDLRKTIELQHTWDYQWQITVLNQRGLSLIPSGNLISNIGDGDDATHTPGDKRCWLPMTSAGFDRERWDASAPEPEGVNAALEASFMDQMNLTPRLGPRILRYARRLWRLFRLRP